MYTKDEMIGLSLKRGDLVFVKNREENRIGHVQVGDRPAIILQNDIGNKNSPTIIVALLTSQLKRLDLPVHVKLEEYKLPYTSMVLLEAIQTISKDDVVEVMDHIQENDLVKIEKALCISLGLKYAA